MDSVPRVILVPGLGGLCVGKDAAASTITRDIAAHTLTVKAQIAAMGTYHGMSEQDIFDAVAHGTRAVATNLIFDIFKLEND